jgi:ABC-type nitrate/sulfonate/bicarbonate transport system permease component
MSRGFPPLRGLLPLLLLLAVWEVVGAARSPYFPKPSSWVQAVTGRWTDGSLPPALLETATTFAVSLVAACVLGTVLGIAIGAFDRADRALGPSLAFARAVPPATLVPIAALLLGYDETMKVSVVTFAATWSVLLNTRAGTRALEPVLLDTARSLHLGPLATVGKCVLPALLPAIFVGIRLATPVALAITLLVEVLTRVNGVGALIAAAQRNYLSAQVYGLLLVAALFSLLVTGSVSRIEAYALRHRPGRA